MFKEYKDRLKQQGVDNQEAVNNSSKRQAINSIMNSATKSKVLMGLKPDIMTDYICIGSDVDTYKERRFLFLPDSKIYKGDYILENGMYYLSIDMTFNPIYPQLFAEHCNEVFDFEFEEKVKVGVTNTGKPIYETRVTKETYPCVLTNKIYSQVENSAVPLPDGAMILKLPFFREDRLIPVVNKSIIKHGDQFKITNINYNNVMTYEDGNEHGFIEVQLQREQRGTE